MKLKSLSGKCGFPGGLVVKNPPANAGDSGLIPDWEDPLEKEMATPPIFLTGKSRGQRSLGGYSPCCYKEWDVIGHTCTVTQEESYVKEKNIFFF